MSNMEYYIRSEIVVEHIINTLSWLMVFMKILEYKKPNLSDRYLNKMWYALFVTSVFVPLSYALVKLYYGNYKGLGNAREGIDYIFGNLSFYFLIGLLLSSLLVFLHRTKRRQVVNLLTITLLLVFILNENFLHIKGITDAFCHEEGRVLSSIFFAVPFSNTMSGLILSFKNIKRRNFVKENIGVPESIRKGIHQYLLYFPRYLKNIKGCYLYFSIIEKENGIELLFEKNQNITEVKIEEWFNEYTDYIFRDINSGNNYKENESGEQIVELKRQLSFLRKCVKVHDVRMHLSDVERNYLRRISSKDEGQESEMIRNVKLLGVQRYIEMGNIEMALESFKNALVDCCEDKSVMNTLCILKSRFYRLKHEKAKGILSHSDYNKEINSICSNLLNLSQMKMTN